MESFTRQLRSLTIRNRDFSQQLKLRLVQESSNVKNPLSFIAALFNEGVLSDKFSAQDSSFGLTVIIVQLVMMITCSKGSDAMDSLMKALEASGNLELISALRTWIQEDFTSEAAGHLRSSGTGSVPVAQSGTNLIDTIMSFVKDQLSGKSEARHNFGGEAKGAHSTANTKSQQVLGKQKNSYNETSSCGAKLVDNIMLRVEDGFMGQLEGLLVSKASEIVNIPEFYSSLVQQKVLDGNDVQLATGSEVLGRKQIEKVMKAVYAKKMIGSLVVAFQSSSNERILEETWKWLKVLPVRKLNDPFSVRSLAGQPRATATGLFAATSGGLISLDLRTLKATALTSRCTFAVAVNHHLKKVYWSQGSPKYGISRSNFDGSAEEIIVPRAGDYILALAIDTASGNVYFAPRYSHEIKVCNAVGENCAVVISNSSLVNNVVGIDLDFANGFIYWGNRVSSSHSVVRANLDGNNSAIISTGFKDLCGITLDRPSKGVLYWADWGAHTIGTIDVNDGKKRTLVVLESNSQLWGIQVDDDKIYFSACADGTIRSVDKNSSKGLTTIFKSTGYVNHLALFHAPVGQT